MIIIESRTKGIKFEHHKEESLISSQFLMNQKKSKTSPFLIIEQNLNDHTTYLIVDMASSIIFDMGT